MFIEENEKKLLDSILADLGDIPSQFGVSLDPEDYQMVYDYHDMLRAIYPGIEVKNGVSKMVIIHPQLSFVIKIPFNGYWCCNYTDNDIGNDVFIDFEQADCDWDYCALEEQEYIKAAQKGFNKYLAWCQYYCCIGITNHPVYIQEYVIPGKDDRRSHESSRASREKVDKMKGGKICSDEWLANCFDFYGFTDTMDFLDYTQNEDTYVGSDDHANNFGYRLDGSPCLLDYSGYSD